MLPFFISRPFFPTSTTMKLAIVLLSGIVLAVQASDVLDLKDSDFESTIKDLPLVLVEFFAPWCGHCKRLAPEYEKAATRLLKNDPPVPLAKVDCTENTDTCGKYGVSGYPTLKVFRGGEMSADYDGPREENGIVKKMASMAGPSSKELKSAKDFEDFLKREGAAVIGFFTDGKSDEAKAFQKVADSVEDLRFAHTTATEVMDKAKYKDEIVLFRDKAMANKFEDGEVKFTGDASQKDKVKSFLAKEKLGLCAHRTMQNAGDFKTPTFVAFFDVDYTRNPKGSNYWRNRVMKVAKKVGDEGLTAYFAISNKMEHSHELGECGLESASSSEKPIVCAYDDKKRKFKMEEEFSVDSFEKFVRDVLDDNLEPYLKSEPVPESNDEPVKVAVAKNFEELVNDPERDVLIEFYAPWCGHCKSLAPKFDELAEKLKDEPEIRIVKMDATANDVPSPYEVRGFPTLFFAPKGSKSSPKKYEGGREVNDFIKYLAKEATNEMEGFDRKGKKKGGKKKKNIEL